MDKTSQADGPGFFGWVVFGGVGLLVLWVISLFGGDDGNTVCTAYEYDERGSYCIESYEVDDEPVPSSDEDDYLYADADESADIVPSDAALEMLDRMVDQRAGLRASDPNDRSPSTDRYVDCADFDSKWEAQRFFEEQGGRAYDPYVLDEDNDGLACEWGT